MSKEQFNKIFLITAVNGILSMLILFLYKMIRYSFHIVPFLESMHEITKRIGLSLLLIFLLLLLSVKFQLKLYLYIKKQRPWAVTILKIVFILLISLIASLVVNYYFQYFQHLRDSDLTAQWIISNPTIYFAGVLYLFLLFLLVFAVIGNIYISTFLTGLFLIVIGFIHYNKLNIRVEPLYPFDFKQFSQMKDVIPMISEYISLKQLIVFLLLVFVMIVLLTFLKNIRMGLLTRGLILAVTLIMLYSYTNFPKTFMKSFVEKSKITIVKWNPIDNYRINGFLFGFISNFQNNSYKKPEGYSKQKVIETAQKYIGQSDEKFIAPDAKPNIIYIMSESFWDPSRLENLKFSGDPIPHLRKLMTEHPSGNVLSPVFGGATANVEFEALTGFSTSFLNPGVIPYQEMIDKKTFIPSIVSDLEGKGYNTLAIHPFNGVFYKRNVVYNIFGFDQFLDQETMKHNEREPGRVITDLSLTNEILDHIKEQKEPLFIHSVSMQNHMPYNAGAYEENKIQISGLSPESTTMLEVYTEGIRRSDEALKLLADELQKINEPTVVVFWGDHLPILGANRALYKEAGYDDVNSDVNKYKYAETPLLIYSNFKMEQERYEFISPFYIAPILYDLIGLEKPLFYHLLNQLREQNDIRALKGDIIMGSNHKFITNPAKAQNQLLEDYKLLQYDLLMGKQYSLDLLYPK
ncbi:LTA synthase family protein [Neobacillus niacini]|uniref:LTA synthase family protein n=1 Tax=Neobacillus niacini TaxID=86668 RepID=UPI001C8DC670|nr:alkaline phosphatase family protein [Neobacillus niacini]MBY0146322.1 sulfatase-like hydrolase/transferase [Neobacillus niacini]